MARTPTLTDTATPQPKPTLVPPATRTATSLPPRDVPHMPNPSYGIAVAFTGSPDSRRAALTRVQELGFEWVKAQVLWNSIEGSRKGEYNWALADAIVNETSARGLKLLVSVIAAPDWARPTVMTAANMVFPPILKIWRISSRRWLLAMPGKCRQSRCGTNRTCGWKSAAPAV